MQRRGKYDQPSFRSAVDIWAWIEQSFFSSEFQFCLSNKSSFFPSLPFSPMPVQRSRRIWFQVGILTFMAGKIIIFQAHLPLSPQPLTPPLLSSFTRKCWSSKGSGCLKIKQTNMENSAVPLAKASLPDSECLSAVITIPFYHVKTVFKMENCFL